MWFYDGGEQGFLAGKVAVKGTGSNAGIFYDLPQGGPWKPLSRNSAIAASWIFSKVVAEFSSMFCLASL